MDKFLHWMQTNGWIVTITMGLIAATIAVTLYFKNKKRKTLDFSVQNSVSILSSSASSSLGAPITVRVGDHELKRPALITVRYMNTGNQEILKDDLLTPLALTFGGDRQVSAEVVSKSSDNIKHEELEIEAGKAFLCDCLNAGDYIDVQYILEQQTLIDTESTGRRKIEPAYRVKGATSPARRVDGPPMASLVFALISILVFFVLFVTGIVFGIKDPSSATGPAIVGAGLVAAFLGYIPLLANDQFRKRLSATFLLFTRGGRSRSLPY